MASGAAATRAATLLNNELTLSHQITLQGSENPEAPGNIVLTARPPENGEKTDAESYDLKVSSDKIEMVGTEKGVFHAVQTLLQLIEPDRQQIAEVPVVEISDSPRFKYRGMHLDSARHFMPVDFVKKYIRLIARYKFNYFHWHLTDDQGWRIEIKKYPALTEIGAKRRETVVGKNYPPRPYVGDGVPSEGHYTQDDVRDIVAYATAHNVIVIPEIDVPGHASAALAAYREFGCKPDSVYKVKTMWGGFPDVLCPSERTFGFLGDLLDEIVPLFPDSPYIHIGGDEVDLSHWQESGTVAELKGREGLRDEHEVLRWFVDRVGRMAEERGKKIICWDDMIEKGQMPTATVMAWKGTTTAAIAARAGREVIMTPDDKVYFDRPQGEFDDRITLGRVTTINDVFDFDPLLDIPADAVRNIVGGQGSVWTEFIKTPDDVEYMAFPRAIALAEVLWSNPTGTADRQGRRSRDFGDFQNRLSFQLAKLEREAVKFRLPEPSGLSTRLLRKDEKAIINLQTSLTNCEIRFTTDGSIPTPNSTRFERPFVLQLPTGLSVEIKAIAITSNGRFSSIATGKYTRESLGTSPTSQKQ